MDDLPTILEATGHTAQYPLWGTISLEPGEKIGNNQHVIRVANASATAQASAFDRFDNLRIPDRVRSPRRPQRGLQMAGRVQCSDAPPRSARRCDPPPGRRRLRP